LAEADISAPIKQTSEELKKIGRDLADMPDFIAGKQDSHSPDTPLPGEFDTHPEKSSRPEQETGDGKDKND